MREADMARAAGGRAAHAGAAEHPLRAERRLELLDVADAVLEGDGEAVRPQDPAGGRGGSRGIVGVDEHDRHLGAFADRAARGRDAHAVVAAYAIDPQPVAIDRIDVRLPGVDQAHLVPGHGEQPAVAAAHRAGADHRDLHLPSSPRAAADLSPVAGPGKRTARQGRFVLAMLGDMLQEWRASR